LRLFGRLLGTGNVNTVTGYWPRYPLGEEADSIFSCWFSEWKAPEAGRRLSRYLPAIRAALQQDAILVEVFTPDSQSAVLVDSEDTQATVWEALEPVVEPAAALIRFFDRDAQAALEHGWPLP
jgi:hypothetical protein